MKKIICVLLATLIMVSFCACSESDSDDKKETVVIEEKYDENGNILMEPLYMGWNLWYYNEYTYDENQKLLNVTRYTNESKYLDEERYSYREDGTLEKVECYWENFDFEIALYQEKLYDESGILYKIQNYDRGEISDYYTFEYDSEQRCVKKSHYDLLWNGGEYPKTYEEYTYDEAGNCVQTDKYENDFLYSYYTYVYNEDGTVKTENNHRHMGDDEYSVAVTDFTYHNNGKIKDKIVKDGNVRLEEIWDERGGLVSEKHYDLLESGEWFLKRKAEYDGELKIYYTYLKDGRYKTESMRGNAAVTNWMELAWYNPDGSLFCTNHEGSFYDPSGNHMDTPPDVSAWDEAT